MKQRNWLESDRENLKKEYLNIPLHYSERIQRCVQKEIHCDHVRCRTAKTKEYNRLRFGWGKAVICSILLVAVIGGGVIAAAASRLADYMEKEVSQEIKDDIVMMDSEQQTVSIDLPQCLKFDQTSESREFSDALMEVKEVYFDGALLYIYGDSTEEGKEYELGTDRIIVNGKQYVGGVYSTQGMARSDIPDKSDYEYFGSIQLIQENLTGDLKVELPFSVSKRFEGNVIGVGDELREYREDGQYTDEQNNMRYNVVNIEDVQTLGFQTISFTVPAPANETVAVTDQTFEIEDGSVQLNSLILTPSTAYIKFSWSLCGNNAEEKIKELAASGVELVDDDGNVFEPLVNGATEPNGTDVTCEYYQDEDGNWITEKEYYISGISEDVKKLIVHPYRFQNVDQLDLDNAGYLEYGNFEISIE